MTNDANYQQQLLVWQKKTRNSDSLTSEFHSGCKNARKRKFHSQPFESLQTWPSFEWNHFDIEQISRWHTFKIFSIFPCCMLSIKMIVTFATRLYWPVMYTNDTKRKNVTSKTMFSASAASSLAFASIRVWHSASHILTRGRFEDDYSRPRRTKVVCRLFALWKIFYTFQVSSPWKFGDTVNNKNTSPCFSTIRFSRSLSYKKSIYITADFCH